MDFRSDNETFLHLSRQMVNSAFTLLLAGTTFPYPEYRIVRDGSEEIFVLEYIVSGCGYLRVGGHEYMPKGGDVYFLQPSIEHEYGANHDNPWKKIWFNLKGPLIHALCDAYGLRSCVYFPNCPLLAEFRHGMEIIRENTTDSYQRLGLQIHTILARLAQYREEHADFRSSPEGLAMREYIQTHWTEEVRLSALAALIRRSKTQTLRIFRSDWGTTPYAYLQKIRLQNAKQYLENSDEAIKNIAAMCGFCDEYYFSNWFKARTGIAPYAFRRRFRVRPA